MSITNQIPKYTTREYDKYQKLLTMVSLVVRKPAKRVGTKPGAIQLTRVFGPISVARAWTRIHPWTESVEKIAPQVQSNLYPGI